MNIGGVAYLTVHLSRHYEKNVHFEHLLVYGPCKGSENEYQELASVNDKICLYSLGRNLNLFFDFISLLKLYGVILRWKPDIIETHAFKPGILLWILHSFFSRKVRIIHHYHGHLLEGYFGKVGKFVYCWVEKLSAKSKDCLTVDNQCTMKDLLHHGIGSAEQFELLRNGVKAPDVSNQKIRKEIKKVSFVGRFVDVKSPQTFIEIARLVSLINVEIEFEMVGEGPLAEQLKILSQELGVPITFHGFSNDLYSDIFPSVDLLVVTSLNEGVPLIIKQANFCGIPVISTSVGGIPEIVLNGINGFCEDSVVEMARRILQLSYNQRLTKELSSNSLKEAETNFTLENYISNHSHLISSYLPRLSSM